jgi:hypothetical protein
MIARKILAIPLLLVMVPTDLPSAERLRVAVSNYNLSSLSMGVAYSRGFFKEEGFDSEVIRMNPNVATAPSNQIINRLRQIRSRVVSFLPRVP